MNINLLNINLIQSKHNKTVYISKICPFCNYSSKKPFRYNSKLKVGKSFCCGISFKCLTWFNLILSNRLQYEIIKIKNDPFLKSNKDKNAQIKRIKDKMNMKPNSFEKLKSNDDLSTPF